MFRVLIKMISASSIGRQVLATLHIVRIENQCSFEIDNIIGRRECLVASFLASPGSTACLHWVNRHSMARNERFHYVHRRPNVSGVVSLLSLWLKGC